MQLALIEGDRSLFPEGANQPFFGPCTGLEDRLHDASCVLADTVAEQRALDARIRIKLSALTGGID